MGAAAGERVVRAYDRARDLRLPMVALTRTGGARLQEGMVALVQLARTAAAARRHAEAGLLSLAVYGSPTTGGVLASYASLVDVRAVVAGAVIGFAGPRVAEGTLGVPLPPGSHTAESAYEHGLADALPRGRRRRRLGGGGAGADRSAPADPSAAHLGAVSTAAPPARTPGSRCCAPEPSDGRPASTGRRGCARRGSSCGGRIPRCGPGWRAVAGRRCVVVATDRYCASGRPTPAGFRLAQRAVQLGGTPGAAGGHAGRHPGRRSLAGGRGGRGGVGDRPHAGRARIVPDPDGGGLRRRGGQRRCAGVELRGPPVDVPSTPRSR